MVTISIRQPWAWWIERGWKTTEAKRHKRLRWLAGRRVAIHAGKFIDMKAIRMALPYLSEPQMQETIMSFNDALKKPVRQEFDDPRFGAVLFTAELMDFRRLTFDDNQDTLWDSHGLYGFSIENLEMLKYPIPWKGSINVFHVPDELIIHDKG